VPETSQNSDTHAVGQGTLQRLAKVTAQEQKVLQQIAKELSDTNPLNLAEKKRKIYKSLRELLV
jgi:cell division protein FtsX